MSAARLEGSGFVEGFVEADGFRIRYLEGGDGDPLLCLHGAGGLRISKGHELLAATRRVVAVEVPGFGDSPKNDRSSSARDLAATVLAFADSLGLESFDLMGSSFGGRLALWVAVTKQEAVRALVLVAPAAILPERPDWESRPPTDPSLLYAHPERVGPRAPLDPAVVAKQQELVRRVSGPPRNPELEERMAALPMPSLVLFGTSDRVIPPEMGRHYRRILPNCQLVYVYDAGHALDADRPEAFVSAVDDFLTQPDHFLVASRSGLIHP